MKLHKLFLALMFLLVVSPLALAHETDISHEENLPANLQKVNEYQNEQANFYFSNLSFFIVFLVGILTLLTPCSLAILPAFFAYSFEGKRQITKMTLIFFLGFMPIFIIFGLLATFFGRTIAMFQQSNSLLVLIAGIVIMIFGFMVLLGKGFSGFQVKKKTDKTPFGMFLFGVLFALGFTVCMGPILVGVLLIAGVLQNYLYSGFLMFFFSLGLFVPLFLISILFDKYNFTNFMNNLNKRFGFSLTNLISGVLLILVGIIFIIYRGTSITGSLGLGSWTIIVYSIQEKILLLPYVNIIGAVALFGFLYLLWRVLKNKRGVNKK